MDRITRNQSFGIFVAATRILLLLAALGSLAEARQPPNASLLLGTWVNVKNTDFFSVARIVITDVSGDFEVHPYGYCSPTLCDWGMHPAFRFSNSVVSSTAFGFNVVFGLSLKSVYMQVARNAATASGHKKGFATVTEVRIPAHGSAAPSSLCGDHGGLRQKFGGFSLIPPENQASVGHPPR